MIAVFVKGQAIEATSTVIVEETYNYLKAQFLFTTNEWANLEKEAYFTKDNITHSIILDKNNVAYPLHLSAGKWKISVVGRDYVKGELTERITTDEVEIEVKPFKVGTETPFPLPEPTEIEALSGKMGKLSSLLTSAKTSLVDAINELYRKGGTGGGNGGFSPIVTIEPFNGGHRITIVDAEGEKSFDVFDGIDGTNGVDGKDGEKGEKGDKGDKGEDGKDGSDYILTDTDKTEIANAVLDALETAEGGLY